MSRTLEHIAAEPQAGDVVMVPFEVTKAGIDVSVLVAGGVFEYERDEWAELCRSAKLPGDLSE